jgi:hypothetical protein
MILPLLGLSSYQEPDSRHPATAVAQSHLPPPKNDNLCPVSRSIPLLHHDASYAVAKMRHPLLNSLALKNYQTNR